MSRITAYHQGTLSGPLPTTIPNWVKAGTGISMLSLGLLSLVLLRWALRSPQTFDSAFARLF
jgi:type IV secretory pathway TrbD component